jgi:hypothetical protein
MKHEWGDIEIDVKDEIDLGVINTYSGAKTRVYCRSNKI